ncbi:peptide ABC transporter permease [Brevibacillus reuszeri]|uniref:Nickel import system permease protein NikB n=1 Tax=Brevibacillus reuszeri TaxID=54915 RepID=A0A0K9YKV6_9BACL|nr:nickel ABC transporter permease [Brevibacillus reuszeri]KNB69358.1 peptide ABC transporter permease [Brevibacillus reuszeri]MED1860338.1 ABC transporter permease [Brevibacillus reuszeri]GED70776.1 peptide ABC transporter permease [Brevibacillus reuszeri]
MRQFIIQRLGTGLIVLIGISIFSFALIHLIPGDPIRIMLGENATAEQVQALREQLGLNRPLLVQYFHYAAGVLQGDLGTSFKTGRPVLTEILERFPATVKLAASGMLLAIIIGITMGIIAARFKDTFLDFSAMSLATLGVSIPSFWLGILLIMLFTVKLGWLPIAGGTGLKDIVLPAVTLGVLASTVISRLTRAGMVEVLSFDYIRTARAKGLGEGAVLFIHAFRNAMIPVVTIVGLQIASLLGGTVIIERVFDWPGLGSLAIGAIASRDFPLVQGIILFIGVIFVLINILVDILYSFIDPRIEVGQPKEGT